MGPESKAACFHELRRGLFDFFMGQHLAQSGRMGLAQVLLTVLGYSINDTIVIFDRIRENFRKYRKASLTEVIDSAITQTMSRTVITHGCTQIVVIAMLLFGGEVLYYFALALTIGILFGIYSSIMVGSSIIMLLRVKREDLVKAEKKPLENDGAVV